MADHRLTDNQLEVLKAMLTPEKMLSPATRSTRFCADGKTWNIVHGASGSIAKGRSHQWTYYDWPDDAIRYAAECTHTRPVSSAF